MAAFDKLRHLWRRKGYDSEIGALAQNLDIVLAKVLFIYTKSTA